MKTCMIIPVFLFLYSIARSQTLTYQTLSMENGLSDNQIHCLMQDSKGYLWFGTKNGVCRWDSKNFQYFTIEHGLPNNEVMYIYEDQQGRVWFSSFSRELAYYYNGVIYNGKNDADLSKLKISPGSKLIAVNDELYFVSPTHKLSKYNKRTGKITFFNKNYLAYQSYFILNRNKVWVIDYADKYANNLISADSVFATHFYYQPNFPNTNVITKIDYKNKKYYFQNGLDSPFYASSYRSEAFQWTLFNNGNVLEIYSNELFFKKANYHIPVDYKGYPSLFFLKNIFYMSTANAILVCKQIPLLEFNSKTNIRSNSQYLFKYKSKIYSIDAEFRITDVRTQKQINVFKKDINHAYGFYNYNHHYYLVTPGKIYHFDNPFSDISVSNKLASSNFKNMTPGLNPGKFFSANGNNGIFRLDLEKNSARKIMNNKELWVYSVFEDHSGRFWYATLNKVYYTRSYKDTIQHTREFPLDEASPLFCNQFAEDKHGNIFFITNGGVFIYDGKWKYKIDQTNLLTDNECRKLLISDDDNSFWIATRKGLNHIKYTTNGGKMNFEVVNKFLTIDGLHSNAINDILLDSSKLYIATDKGVHVLDDLNYRPDSLDIPVYIKLSAINGVNSDLQMLQRSRQLNYKQNNLTLTFSALYFLRRDRLKVKAYLFRNNELISQNEITEDKIDYYSLNDGSYELVLYAYDRDYPYIHSKPVPYYFKIRPPYYKTWWFISGSSLLIIALSTGLLLWSLNRRRQRKLEQAQLTAQLNESNLKSLQSQMNPHFVFNSLNTIQYFITNKNEEAALNYLSDFSGLIREILEQSVNNMVSLEHEISFLEKYIQLEMVRFKYSFTVYWNIALSEDDFTDIYIPTMLIQPILENAVKHGISHLENTATGKIDISIKLQHKNLLVVTIKDNGTAGANKSAKGNSIAIQTIKDRLRIYSRNGIKGEYHLSLTETGATATITIPI